MTKILISAGEASGDLHAGAVTEAIKQLDKDAEVFGMGGDALRNAGGEVLFDIKEHSVMGLLPVIKKLPSIIKLMCDFVRIIDERKPDCLITVDYPGFNMELAKVCQRKGIPVISFIAPSAKIFAKISAIFTKRAFLISVPTIIRDGYKLSYNAFDSLKNSGEKIILSQ